MMKHQPLVTCTMRSTVSTHDNVIYLNYLFICYYSLIFILEITFESYDQSTKVLEHLLLRLKKNMSAAVKLKVLIVMKSIIQKGNPQFRRDLQRKSEEIRECLCKSSHVENSRT